MGHVLTLEITLKKKQNINLKDPSNSTIHGSVNVQKSNGIILLAPFSALKLTACTLTPCQGRATTNQTTKTHVFIHVNTRSHLFHQT